MSASTSSPAGDPTPSLQAGRAAGNILLVEDHADSAEMTAMMLQLEGWQVDVAASAAQARELAAARRYDVVIGDVGLPDGCGLTLLAALHEAQSRFGATPPPAVALSGYGRDTDRERSLAAGYAAHLLKPVDGRALVALLQELLAQARR